MVRDYKNSIKTHPGIGFTAKILIDDGTFEAIVTLTHQTVKEMFSISESMIEENKESVLTTTDKLIIYDRFNNKSLLSKSTIDELMVTKFIGYCLPYSNVSKKVSNDNNYNALFKNLNNKEETMKEKCQSLIFINGDVVTDVFMNDSYLTPRPLLKLVHFENIN